MKKVLYLFTFSLLGFVSVLDAWTICIDPGHGGSDPGVVGDYYTEKQASLYVGLKFKWYLEKVLSITQIGMTRDTDTAVSLQERVDYANSNNFDRFISIHQNAYDGTVQGTETYCYDSASAYSFDMRDSVQKELVNAYHYRDRGGKTADWYVLHHTIMPAILGESSFLDYNGSYNESWRYKYDWYGHIERQAYGYTKGLCEHLGIDYPAFVLHTEYPDSVDADSSFTVKDSFYVPNFQSPADIIFEVKTLNGDNIIYTDRVNNIGEGYYTHTWQISSLPDSGYDYYVYFMTTLTPSGGNWGNRYDHISTGLLPTKVKTNTGGGQDTSFIVFKNYPTEVYADSNIIVVDSVYVGTSQSPADLIFEVKDHQTGSVLYQERKSSLSAGTYIDTFITTLPDSGYDYQVHFLLVLTPPGGDWGNRYTYTSTYGDPTTIMTNSTPQDTSFIVFKNYPTEVYADSNIIVTDSFHIASSNAPADLVFEIRHFGSGNVLYSKRISSVDSGYHVYTFGVDTPIILPDSGYNYKVYFYSMLTPSGGSSNSIYACDSTYSHPTTVRTNSNPQDTGFVVFTSYPTEVYADSNIIVVDSFHIPPSQSPSDLIFEIKHYITQNVLCYERINSINAGDWVDTFGVDTSITLPDSGHDYQVYFVAMLTPTGGDPTQAYAIYTTYSEPTTVKTLSLILEGDSTLVMSSSPIYSGGKLTLYYSIKNKGKKDLYIRFFDIQGRVVKQIKLNSLKGRVETLLRVPNGVYYYALCTSREVLKMNKLIVVR